MSKTGSTQGDQKKNLGRQGIILTWDEEPPGRKCYARRLYDGMRAMNWSDAAEDFLNQVLAQTPRPVRESTEAQLRGLAESMAEEGGLNRVGVETVIAAWVRGTPETVRADLPRQMERFGLDPDEYRHLLES